MYKYFENIIVRSPPTTREICTTQYVLPRWSSLGEVRTARRPDTMTNGHCLYRTVRGRNYTLYSHCLAQW